MDQKELEQIYDSTPEDDPRSRLEPYRELILRWRRRGRSYEKIRQDLRDRCNVKVAHGTLFNFVKRRSRPRKPEADLEMETVTVEPMERGTLAATSGKRLSAEERAAQVEFIRSLNNKPVVEEQPKTGWNFAVDKPRTIQKS